MSIPFSNSKLRYVLDLNVGDKLHTRRLDSKQLTERRKIGRYHEDVDGCAFEESDGSGNWEIGIVSPKYKPGKIYPMGEGIKAGRSEYPLEILDVIARYSIDNHQVLVDDRTVPWPGHWKNNRQPPRFMPHLFARRWVEVLDVGVERLGDISEEDARLEGAPPYVGGHGPITEIELRMEPGYRSSTMYRDGFEWLWNEVNDPRNFEAWERDLNQWVWVYSLRMATREEWLNQEGKAA